MYVTLPDAHVEKMLLYLFYYTRTTTVAILLSAYDTPIKSQRQQRGKSHREMILRCALEGLHSKVILFVNTYSRVWHACILNAKKRQIFSIMLIGVIVLCYCYIL